MSFVVTRDLVTEIKLEPQAGIALVNTKVIPEMIRKDREITLYEYMEQLNSIE